MKKHPEIQEATKRNFAEALAALYNEGHTGKTDIGKLSEKAGYNRATFYRYFSDLYDLYYYIESFVFTDIKNTMSELFSQGNFESGYTDTFTGLYKKWNIYIPLIFDDIGSVRIADIKKELITVFCEDRGLPAGNIELEYSMDMYISCVLSSINKWRHDGRDLSYEALGALIQKLLMHGILPQIIAYLPDKTNRI